jgi:uncharacterized cofD-like protein
MGVKRHVLVAVLGTLVLVIGAVTGILWIFGDNRQTISQPLEDILVSSPWRTFGGWISLGIVLGGAFAAVTAVGQLNRSLLSNWMPRPHEAARLLHHRLQLARGPRIVAIGGGTGLSNLLRGLRSHTSNVTAVVAVSDDGGSSGRLRQAFDMPAPGDLADCLSALSDNELEVSRLMGYRFERGAELEGHTFGNLLITTLTEVEGDFGRAARVLNRLLNLSGSVYPVTAQPVSLRVTKADGSVVRGESSLRSASGAAASVSVEPSSPNALPEVVSALVRADLIVLGPGSLFTSTLPPVLVPEVKRSLQDGAATIVYVCNIMTEAGETDGFTVRDHVEVLRRHVGRAPDVVVVNTRPVDEARLSAYASEHAEVVLDDAEALEAEGIVVERLPLLSDGPHAQHDSGSLAEWLVRSLGERERATA